MRMTINELWPNRFGEGFAGSYSSPFSGIGSPEFDVELNALQRAINDCFEFVEILHFASLGETFLGFFRSEPRRLSMALVRLAHLMYFHQKCFDHEFLHATGLPENSLGVDVEMEVTRLDGADRSRLFCSFAFRRLAVR